MGACATKSGDLKVKGEPAPLVVEDAVAEEEKPKKPAYGVPVPAAAQTDPADVSRRRSLSDLLKLKEDTEASDDRDEADQEAVKVVTEEDSVGGAPPANLPVLEEVAEATKAPDVAVVPPAAVVEQDTDTEASDDRDEAAQEAVKVEVATEDSAGGAPPATATLPEEEEAEAAKAPDVAVVPPSTADPAVVEQDTVTEQEADDGAKASQEQEEEKRVDPDSVQVAAAPSGEEESKVDGPSS